MAFPDSEEKLLEGFEQSDVLCLVLKGSLWLPSREQTSRELIATGWLSGQWLRPGAGCVQVVRAELTWVPTDRRRLEVRGQPGQLLVFHLSLGKNWPSTEVRGGRRVSRPVVGAGGQ